MGLRFIVMTASASMSGRWNRGRYHNIAIVARTVEYARLNKVPKMISARALGIQCIVWHGGPFHSKGSNPAFFRMLARADERCAELNRGIPIWDDERLNPPTKPE